MSGNDAEISKLRAFAARTGPIVRAALELREMGRSLDRLDAEMVSRKPDATRSGTMWLVLNQGYEAALEQFDEAVKNAALSEFADIIDPTVVVPFKPNAGAKASPRKPL